ncbi:MAG: AzlC family ABC transporter permease [Bacillota bacterium]
MTEGTLKERGNPVQVFWLGIKEGAPLACSIFAYGLVFGLLARQGALSYWETLLMSGAVFAGSSQFVAVSMMAVGAAPGQIILATFLLSLRHLLMGASLAPYLAGVKFWKLAVLAHFLNDESYALTVNRFQQFGGSAAYFLGVGVATFVGWFLSSALAGIMVKGVGDLRVYGLDFAFLGAFIGLLIPQLKDARTWTCFVVAALVALAVIQVLPGKWYILIAALAAGTVGAFMETQAHHGRLLKREA